MWAKFFKTIDLQIYTGHSEINRPVITNYGQEIFMPRIKLFSPFMQDLATNTDITTSAAWNKRKFSIGWIISTLVQAYYYHQKVKLLGLKSYRLPSLILCMHCYKHWRKNEHKIIDESRNGIASQYLMRPISIQHFYLMSSSHARLFSRSSFSNILID